MKVCVKSYLLVIKPVLYYAEYSVVNVLHIAKIFVCVALDIRNH